MVRFEWDESKNQQNAVKHGVDFQTAQLIFDDPHCITFVERTKDGEPRWHGIGSVAGLILLVVVHTYREVGADQVIRMIPARRATRYERRLYETATDA